MIKQNKDRKHWQLLEDALNDPFVTLNMKQIYNYVHNRILHDGFVIKKGHANKWEFFCMTDYMKWKGLNHVA